MIGLFPGCFGADFRADIIADNNMKVKIGSQEAICVWFGDSHIGPSHTGKKKYDYNMIISGCALSCYHYLLSTPKLL